MATVRAKLAIKNLGKTRTEEQALINANYSPSYARSGQIKKTKGWNELMEEVLPDSLLVKRHKELLNKRETAYVDGKREKIDEPDTQAVSKGLDMAYKLKNRYPKEDINLNFIKIDGVEINVRK